MKREKFEQKYNQLMDWAAAMNTKARREGLLSLEDELDNIDDEFLKRGMRLVVDGVASEFIEKILSNLTAQEKDEYSRIIKTMQKEAVLMMQDGIETLLMLNVLNSYTDIPFDAEKILYGADEEDDDESELQYEQEEGRYDAEV